MVAAMNSTLSFSHILKSRHAMAREHQHCTDILSRQVYITLSNQILPAMIKHACQRVTLDRLVSLWLCYERIKTNGEALLKKLILTAGLVVFATATAAQAQYGGTGSNSSSHTRQGYTTSSGTYVPPSHATNPNSTTSDNYSTRGNVNPYTGAVGTRSPR